MLVYTVASLQFVVRSLLYVSVSKNTSLFHCHIVIRTCADGGENQSFRPFREDALIERQAHCVHLANGTVEVSFKVPMCTKRFGDVP